METWAYEQGGSKKLPPLHFQELKAQIQYEMIRNHASCSPHVKGTVQRYAGGGYDRGLDAGSSGEQQTPRTGPLLALCKTLVSIEQPAHQNYEEPVS